MQSNTQSMKTNNRPHKYQKNENLSGAGNPIFNTVNPSTPGKRRDFKIMACNQAKILITRCILSLLLLAGTARAEVKPDIEFAKVDGTNLTLDVYVPEGNGPFPACILVHGGGWTHGDKRTFIKPLFEPLSKAGFAWFSINYRLAPKHHYPACVEDVESAIRWVKAHTGEYHVDPERIALIGESAGGHLVSLAGVRAKADTRVAAVVPFYAPHDLELQREDTCLKPLFGLKVLNDAARKKLREASPITYVHKGLPPFLLVHGTKDKGVPLQQSLKFKEKMAAAGNVCDLIVVEGGIHGMENWETIDPSYKDKLIAWLRNTLGSR